MADKFWEIVFNLNLEFWKLKGRYVLVIGSTPVTHFASEDMLRCIFTLGLKVPLKGTCKIKTCDNDEVKAGALVNTNTESITLYEAEKAPATH